MDSILIENWLLCEDSISQVCESASSLVGHEEEEAMWLVDNTAPAFEYLAC
jgi:hypothetical protein